MNHEPVFEFSEHFDGEFLRQLFDGNLEHVIALFEDLYQTIPELLRAIRDDMASADWINAATKVHQLKSTVKFILKSNHPEELRRMEHQLYHIIQPLPLSDTPTISREASNIIADFHRIHLEILAARQFVLAEINRMRIYLSHPQRRH
ncbi:hypothetical protein HF329_10765 [Chitinophaga oryzae]|uniref:HPt domain-containing protein n=1 Tax=Chitinophaga oryzae TaxID=2725414 RepID=A0AAE6ZHY0_9BACT|nr:hypothetical protein [Chitinophaga oryzae]QJB31774.1 hypothetical protein HF329_10765 [Chitinophaga oryzae]